MANPKVSALLPVFNTEPECLRETINSILSQDFEDFELLIIDDGSAAPEVGQVISSYQDPRIVFTKNEKNLGIALTRNKLIEMSRGEYLAVVDHDDISTPDRFRKEVGVLDANPEVGVVGSFNRQIPSNTLTVYPKDNDTIEEMLLHNKNSIFHPTTMIRKSVLLSNNLKYKPEFTPAEDYLLFCDLIGKTKFANIPETLLYYRWNKKNISYAKRYLSSYLVKQASSKAAEEHPDIWLRGKSKIVNSYYYTLFGFIPILTIREQGRKIIYLLFGVLPVLKRRYRGSATWG